MKKYVIGIAVLVILLFWISTRLFVSYEPTINKSMDGKCILLITVKLDLTIGVNTIYGEQPQLAVWLENPGSDSAKTIYVTRRAGKNDWDGKIMCPVALPYWESRSGIKKVKTYERKDQFDAVSSATPKSELINIEAVIDSGSVWKYFLEVNVSGDFNEAFPQYPKNSFDSEGNGQPSLIYGGTLKAIENYSDEPTILGMTDQIAVIDSFYTELDGITTAQDLIKEIRVKIFK